MWYSMIIKFVVAHWRTIAVAVVAGVLVAGVGTLYGLYRIEKGTRIGLEAELDAAHIRQATTEESLDVCVETNAEWGRVAETWRDQTEAFRRQQRAYQSRLDALSEQRSQIMAENANLLQRIAAIDADDCSGAVDQLIAALEWGAE